MPHPNYILLYVTDPSASAAFYTALLACPPVEASPSSFCDGVMRIGRALEKIAGVFLIGFGIKLAISK